MVVCLDEVSLSLNRLKLLMIALDPKLLLERRYLVPNLVFSCPLHGLVFVIPLVPHIECAVESALLVGSLFKLSQ